MLGKILITSNWGSLSSIVESTSSDNILFYTLLNAASEVGDIEMIENLLHQINYALHIPYFDDRDQLLMTCFPLAALGNHVAAIDKLLENGAYPDGSSGLMSALIVQDQTLVRLFLDLAVPFFAHPALMWLAVRWGNLEVIQDLIDAGISLHGYSNHINFIGGNWWLPSLFTNSLGEALKKQDRQITQVLMKNGAGDRTAQSSQFGKYSTLTLAVQFGDIYMVRDLLSRGADPNDPTALLEAASQSPMMVQLIYSLGARVNCKVELGITRTPLQLATELGSYEIVEFLIRHCDADVNAEPCIWDGRTALQLAASLCFVQIAELLLRYGADINAPRGKYEGRTAFEGAAEYGRIEMLLFLSHNGLHLRLDREQACRAMELATKNGQPAASELVKTISESSNLSLSGFSPLAIT